MICLPAFLHNPAICSLKVRRQSTCTARIITHFTNSKVTPSRILKWYRWLVILKDMNLNLDGFGHIAWTPVHILSPAAHCLHCKLGDVNICQTTIIMMTSWQPSSVFFLVSVRPYNTPTGHVTEPLTQECRQNARRQNHL